MKKRLLLALLALAACMFALALVACSDATEEEVVEETEEVEEVVVEEVDIDATITVNGEALTLIAEGTVELSQLSVENGVTVNVEAGEGVSVTVNGEEVTDSVDLDITAITSDATIDITADDGEKQACFTVNLLPANFGEYETEGESATEGDYYLTTYRYSNSNYVFKLNGTGELVFYKKTPDIALDFQKNYNSDGEARYTYLLYQEEDFCGLEGINPACIVVMDEDYNEIETIYYTTSEGEDRLVDPHGFIYLDDGHYILTSYVDEYLDVPEDLEATDNSAYMAVLCIEEIQDGEILWEFCSADYEKFLYETTALTWSDSISSCHDYIHFNSMYIDEDGNLLVSCRHLNEILKLSRETGELMWTLGGVGDEFGLTDEQLFSKQHSIIVTDDGSYMIFNNADDEVESGEEEYSTVERLKVDEETMTVTEYTEYVVLDFYANFMGSIRELDSSAGIYLWSVGGNYLGELSEWSVIEYSETEGDLFKFRFVEGNRYSYAANKCE